MMFMPKEMRHSPSASVSRHRVVVSNAFFYEQEYQRTTSYVFRLYRVAYGDDQPSPNPDPANITEAKKIPSYAAFVRDRARVTDGPDLAQLQLAMANLMAQRPEFVSRYPLALTGPQFVDALLATIQTASGANLTSQRDALITLFNQGGRGMVLYRLADDNVQTNPIDNRSFIDAEYLSEEKRGCFFNSGALVLSALLPQSFSPSDRLGYGTSESVPALTGHPGT